jgi:hypothetical protein
VAGLVDAGEGEVAVLADLAAGVGCVCLNTGVAGGGESIGRCVWDGEGDEFAAVPGWKELVMSGQELCFDRETYQLHA